MRTSRLIVAATVLTLGFVTAKPAQASIHEIIAAMCRAGGEEVMPPGQNNDSLNSFVRALQATNFITSIDASDPFQVVVHFDPTVPNSKFKSAGFDLTIPNGAGPGVALVLSPLVIPDEDFAAHAHCHNLH
jgi:hypothetical protein